MISLNSLIESCLMSPTGPIMAYGIDVAASHGRSSCHPCITSSFSMLCRHSPLSVADLWFPWARIAQDPPVVRPPITHGVDNGCHRSAIVSFNATVGGACCSNGSRTYVGWNSDLIMRVKYGCACKALARSMSYACRISQLSWWQGATIRMRIQEPELWVLSRIGLTQTAQQG
jgi:hypothetical protein